jgi:iron complex transport system substrate-binding protein
VRFVDALGNTVYVKKAAKKVVSLMGSFAEAWLLPGGDLVGVTEDALSERKLPLDENVKTVGSVKAPDIEEILALEPDFVIMSADLDQSLKIAETLKNAGIPAAYFKTEYFADYLDMLKIFTDITGREDLYELNGAEVEGQIKAVTDKVKNVGEKNPTVLFLRAFSTGVKAKGEDNMTGVMLKELGAVNIAASQTSLLEDLSMEVIIKEDPDFMFVTMMGNTTEQSESLKSLFDNPAWKTLKAVKNNNYYILPKELFHYKPNNRWGQAYEYLAEILYTDIE